MFIVVFIIAFKSKIKKYILTLTIHEYLILYVYKNILI